MCCFDLQLSYVLKIIVSICTFSHLCLSASIGAHVYLCYMCVSEYLLMIFLRYFPASSTKEMLDEWRPLLCVFDVVMQKAISNMELFLPTIMPPEGHSQGFQ